MSSPLAVLRRLRPPGDADTLTRYARTRDPLLLADLVRRHGGLVWGVCRRALPHRPDAEDAYQATWLVLAANPGAVRTPAALPAFLHAVAVRVCRRVRQKRPLTADAAHLPAREPEAVNREGLAALDEELAKLPEKLRRPLVLCFLDGHTQAEAATALGLSLSTLKRRLEAGRELLRARLAGRGVDLAAVLAAAGLTGVGAPAVVAGGAGVTATALSTEVLSAMWMLKAKTWTAGLVLAAGVTATGGGLMLAGSQRPGGGPPAPVPVARPADPPAAPVTVGQGTVALPPQTLPEGLRAAYVEQIRELERAVAAAEEAEAAQRRVADAYEKLPGVSQAEKLNNTALVARYRENAVRSRVELAKLKVEIAKHGLTPGGQQAVASPVVPARLLKERITTARRFLDLDRQIRAVGAISKEEASAFEMNLRLAAQALYEAVAASDASTAGQLAAAREWYVHSRAAEIYYRKRAERGLNREQVALAASLARNQAEAALVQALAVALPTAHDRLDPFPGANPGYTGMVVAGEADWTTIRPALGLKPLTAVRVSRGGQPVGVLVVVNVTDHAERPEHRDVAECVLLPNKDGSLPAVQVSDDVRP